MTATATATQFASDLASKFSDGYHTDYSVIAGRKFDKIVYMGGSQRMVHAFVERETGGLYKAAGWQAPAKGVRFHLGTEEGYAKALEAADPHGSYLYAR